MLKYWLPPLQKYKISFFLTISNRTANIMHGYCWQLVFVIEVSLCYVRYFVDFKCSFQFTAGYFVIYRVTLIHNVSCHVSLICIYTKNTSCVSLWY
jgi:hypothetical protein